MFSRHLFRLSRSRAAPASLHRRINSTYQAPDSTPKINPHRNFYRQFGRPVAQNFLVALAVYQVLYWSWLKLESMEFRKEKEEEIQGLESELESLREKVVKK